MATTSVVPIEITVSDEGVITAIRGMEGALDKFSQKGNVVFAAMRQQQERARQATTLFARTLGVEMPQALEKVISKSSLIGPLMTAAFNVSIVVALGAAVVALVPRIEEAASAMGGFGK